jgi:sirohydrochlorin cobaltochelatase
MLDTTNKAVPMASAPMRYAADGSVDWGNMWDSFCALALDGGPPHRASMLYADEKADISSPEYVAVVAEVVRAVRAVSALTARGAEPGWVAIECGSAGMARWLSEAIRDERVDARAQDRLLLVPVGANFTLKGEIKNVVTAVAKTTHYWREHLPHEAKEAIDAQERLDSLWRGLRAKFLG